MHISKIIRTFTAGKVHDHLKFYDMKRILLLTMSLIAIFVLLPAAFVMVWLATYSGKYLGTIFLIVNAALFAAMPRVRYVRKDN